MQDRKLCFNDILLVPQYSELDSRTVPNTTTHLGWLELKIPIISAAMDSITGKEMLFVMDQLGGLGILTRYINLPDDKELSIQMRNIRWAFDQGASNVGCAIGIRGDIDHKAQTLLCCGCNVICLDVAHGDHEKMYEAIKTLVKLKNQYRFVIMAGNVCTSNAAWEFANCGVDAIKVGIGPGAACTTRLVTGFGYPQMSAIMQCSHCIEEKFPNTTIIADGGIRSSGDMVKALWGGANACMIGYLLAGTNATPLMNGKRIYRGMSSRAASGRPDIAPEGIEIVMEDRGETERVIMEYVKGIQSGLAMGGVQNIVKLREKVSHVVVSPLSLEETMPRNMEM